MKHYLFHFILIAGIACILISAATGFASTLPLHVCAAMMTYFWFILCVAVNIGISAGKPWNPHHALASCDVGLLFAGVTMTTGAWWGYHAWGSAWVWEPRLTGMFLMTLFFVSWRLACAIAGHSLVSNRKMTASLIILGLPSMFFTHVAVKLFGGIHPSQLPHTTGDALSWLPMVVVAIGWACTGIGFYGSSLHRMQGKGECIARDGQ